VRKCLLIQPHMDDGCLGAAQFIAGRPDTVVVTVFAGFPPDDVTLTPYDRLCGFSTSKDAIATRRAEDREALAYLKATPIHLEHLDSQYGDQDRVAIVADIKRLIDEIDAEMVIFGLGIGHPDHELVREAALEATRGIDRPVWAYEDLPGRVREPETVHKVIHNLAKRGITLNLGFTGTGSLADKLTAIWSYRSQMGLPDFANRHSFLVPERFHLVTRVVTPEEQA
jgi:LmbE family N-acetylglucosaminyl deacetylase